MTKKNTRRSKRALVQQTVQQLIENAATMERLAGERRLEEEFRRLAVRLGINPAGLTIGNLRGLIDTAITNLLRNNEDVVALRRLMRG